MVSGYTWNLFNKLVTTVRYVPLPSKWSYNLVPWKLPCKILEVSPYTKECWEVPETASGEALGRLGVSGGPMKSFGGAVEHLRATSHQVIPPWGQGRGHRLKQEQVRAQEARNPSSNVVK